VDFGLSIFIENVSKIRLFFSLVRGRKCLSIIQTLNYSNTKSILIMT